jgi:hypothetical protein
MFVQTVPASVIRSYMYPCKVHVVLVSTFNLAQVTHKKINLAYNMALLIHLGKLLFPQGQTEMT